MAVSPSAKPSEVACAGSNALKPIVQRHTLNEGTSAISHAHQTAFRAGQYANSAAA
jgi:hypothetical protein